MFGNVYYGLQAPLLSPFGQDEDELFGGVSYTFPWFTVAFTTYGEVIHSVDEWFQLDLTKSIPVDCLCKGATLDLGASFGYLILNHDQQHIESCRRRGELLGFSHLPVDRRREVSNKQVYIGLPENRSLAAVIRRRHRLPGSQLAGLPVHAFLRRHKPDRYVLKAVARSEEQGAGNEKRIMPICVQD